MCAECLSALSELLESSIRVTQFNVERILKEGLSDSVTVIFEELKFLLKVKEYYDRCL